MTVLPFATQIKNAGAAIEANSPIEGEVIFCVQGVISPLLANIAFHGMEQALGVKYKTRGELNGPRALVRYADDVRHFTGRWIPFTERRGLEETTLGPTAYPAVKAKGDRSMPSKRERPEDADGRVPQGPRDKVRTALFEPQSPGMQAYIPRHSV
jgi:hypothetical protein